MDEALMVLQIESKGTVQTIELNEEMTLGRVTSGSNADIPVNGSYISRRHGVFEPEGARCTYTDLGSLNGTWLNGMKLEPGFPVRLRNGDILQISAGRPDTAGEVTTIYFRIPSHTLIDDSYMTVRGETMRGSHTGAHLDVNIRERSVGMFGSRKVLLENIRLSIPAGKMVLILGGSGAGKTTFMNAVMGYEKADAEIIYSGRNIYDEFESMKYEIGYVPQQDLMRGSDSVYETLRNAAELKLPVSIRGAAREERIDFVLDMLGLSREADTAVSRLSGGQRKRLSIALEYVSDPALFFLDEPDSGLDGIMARSLMNSLRSIADEGKIIMVISHSPDRVRELFDGVIVLAKSTQTNCGKLAYYGSPDDAVKFFGVDSLEDIVMRINRPDEGGEGRSDHYIEKFASLQSEGKGMTL